MGEMADAAVEESMDFEEKRSDYHTGHMSVHEAHEEGIVDELGFEANPGTGRKKTKKIECRYCGKGDLQWVKTSKGWRLHDGQAIHTCPLYKR